MALCHSATDGKCCSQQDLSIIPLIQHLHRVLDKVQCQARFPPSHAAYHPSFSCTYAGKHRFPCHLAIAHLTSIWPGRTGAACCVFLSGSLAVCHRAGLWGHTGHPVCLVGSGPSVPAWPLLPASSHLHSTTSSSSCSTWNSHFSFPKIKNRAESSQNLRWEALLRTEARWAVFQRLIAFSGCISIYIFPQHWNPQVLGRLRKAGALVLEDKEPR